MELSWDVPSQSLAGQGQSRNEEDGDVGLVNSQRLRPHQASLPLKRARYACLTFEDMSVATAWRFGAGCVYVCVNVCVFSAWEQTLLPLGGLLFSEPHIPNHPDYLYPQLSRALDRKRGPAKMSQTSEPELSGQLGSRAGIRM